MTETPDKQPPLGTVVIVGFGLIGSSMARVIKLHGLATKIICADRSMEVCKKVESLALADLATTDLSDSVREADLVIIATPIGAVSDICRAISATIPQSAIVTDVCSVKSAVIASMRELLPSGTRIVPAHPIAGTEFSGPQAGFAELFIDRFTIITPIAESDPEAIERVRLLWQTSGSQIAEMTPEHHDRVLAITSHLPHLIAYTIVGTVTDLENQLQAEIIKYSASGFRDFTRIAASDPIMWRDIFLNNREPILEMVMRLQEDLAILQRAIRTGNGQLLEDHFSRTRAIRRSIIAAKQA